MKHKRDLASAAVKETPKRQKQLEPAVGQAPRHAAQGQPLSQSEMAAERDFPEHARAVKVEGSSAAEPTSAEQAAWDIPEACVVSDIVIQVCNSCIAYAPEDQGRVATCKGPPCMSASSCLAQGKQACTAVHAPSFTASLAGG